MQFQNNDLSSFLTKFTTAIIMVAVGVLGKISYELVMKRKLGVLQWIGIVGVSVFVGYLSYMWCNHSGFTNQLGVIVPIATLLGERILIYVTSNSQLIFQKILSLFIKK